MTLDADARKRLEELAGDLVTGTKITGNDRACEQFGRDIKALLTELDRLQGGEGR